jgi:small subunit ribosomal protein S18
MARGNERTSRRGPKDAARRTKKKPCALCRDKIDWVDYKDVPMLRKYMSDRGKIRARRVTGNCAQHQREIALAIKTARELVLLPYTQRTVTERSGGRGRGRGERGGGFPRPGGPPSAGAASGGEAAEADADTTVADDGSTPEQAGAPDAEVSAGGTQGSAPATPDGAEPAAVGAPPEADA